MVDRESGRLVATNEALIRLLGTELSRLEDTDAPFDHLVHRDDRSIFRTWLQGDMLAAQSTFGVRFWVMVLPFGRAQAMRPVSQ